MNCKRLWSTIVVSFICILLASSFVMQTSAETISQTFSLQSVAVVDAVFDTNEEEQPADLSYVQNVSVTEENPVPEMSYNKLVFYPLNDGSGYVPQPHDLTDYGQLFLKPGTTTGSLYAIGFDGDLKDFSFGLENGSSSYVFGLSLSDSYFACAFGGVGRNALGFSSVQYLTAMFVNFWTWYSTQSSSSYITEYNDALFIINDRPSDNRLFIECWVDDVRQTFDLLGNTLISDVIITCSRFENLLYVRYSASGIYVFDLNTRSYVKSLYVPVSGDCCPIAATDDSIFIFGDSNNEYYIYSLSSGELSTVSYPSPVNLYRSGPCCAVYRNGSIYLPASAGMYCLTYDETYYYDPLDYQVSPNIEVDKYINFSYQGTSDGTQNGDGFIGLDLNFGVPASYFASNEVTSVRFQSFAYSYSSSADQFVTDNVPLPYNVQMTGENLNVLATYYPKLVGQVGDLYLYNYNVIFYVDASRVDSFDISLNTYIPAQTETHWFSIPCSTLDISYYDSGGGGGSGGGSDLSQIEADLVIIQDQMSGMLTKFDDVSEGISQVENRLDEIQNILTSLPDDHESNMQHLSENFQSAEQMESEINSYIDEYMSVPSMDASIEAGFSDGVGIIEDVIENQNTVYLFEFIRNMWTVHPYLLNMTSIVVVLGVLGIYIRSA